MSNPLNENEQKFLELLKKANSFVPGDCELEIDYIETNAGMSLQGDGWYAMKYKEGSGAYNLTEFQAYSNKPLITEDEANEQGIDVEKVINYYGCYYVGP